MFPLLKENIKIAFGSIKTQLLRTILTVLIIGIGIMALVGILSAVSALESSLASNFSFMGANTFNIQQYELTIRVGSGRGAEREKVNPVINYNQVKEFEDEYRFPFSKTAISFYGTRAAEIKFENKKTDPEVSVVGVNENFMDAGGWEIEDGRGFNSFDVENNNNVCVIGSDIYDDLLSDINPVDQTISLRGSKFKIIGVLKAKPSVFGNNQNMVVLIPLQKARTIFTNPNINYNLSVKSDKKDMLDGAVDEAILTFRNVRGLSPVEENNFGINRSDDLINRIGAISKYLYLAAWIISIITILGSSIALMNIMLVSVSERTREIGVRKALGAKQKTIAGQFFIETIIVGQLGGLVGIILGTLIGFAFSKILGLPFSLPWFAMLWAVIVTFIVAVISGSYPASKASKLDPIESLRYE
ncbi:putative ABC transport system permease protein [Flavobacteriaceae bacterium MAR_2010_188]|nr:putative ABC transport system permease protein [Flavobacteriaceae bacterium MAR_2010_188]